MTPRTSAQESGPETVKPSYYMACSASRQLIGKRVAFIGVGIPMIGAYLAQRTHNPDLKTIIELGVVGSRPERLPISLTDPALVKGATCACDMVTALGIYLHYVDIGFIGGAQVDRYGNLNSTAIGDYYKPAVRLVGSGGANDISSIAKTYAIVMRQDKTKFVEKADYITTVGYYKGHASRKTLDLPGEGPNCVISDMAVFKFEEGSQEMVIDSYYPIFSLDEVKKNVGYDVKVSDDVRETPPPTPQELKILTEVDPHEYYLR